MEAEPLRFAELLEARKESARQTLREVSEAELLALIPKIFPDGTHPWAEEFTAFIHAHRAERAVECETSDQMAIIYFPACRRGFWYQLDGLHGVGLLGDGVVATMVEITGSWA